MSEYKLVPVEPTKEMIDAYDSELSHSHCPGSALEAAINHAPEVEKKPIGWVVVGPNGCMSDVQTDHLHAVDLKSDMDLELSAHHSGTAHKVMPVYTTPTPQLSHGVSVLVQALESIAEYWNRDNNEDAMLDACNHAVNTAKDALDVYLKGGKE